MSVDERDLELLRGRPLPWDDLREQRVLTRIEDALEARPQGTQSPTPSRTPWLWLLIAATVMLSVGLGTALMLREGGPSPVHPPHQAVQTAQAVRSWSGGVVAQAPSQTTLTLLDGSTARMDSGASVDVLGQTPTVVRLSQSVGSVRYDVTRNEAREFIVEADGVQVRVLGTAFTVTLLPAHVAVHVHHGRVEVLRGDRRSVLELGETLQIERGAIEAEDDPIVIEDDEGAQPVQGGSEDDRGNTRNGDSERAVERTSTPPRKRHLPSVDTLQSQADEARAAGRLDDAASALRTLVRGHRKDARAYSAWFQLGKVERARGRHAAAAQAFEGCAKRSPGGALSEDARAEAAVSWQAAGKRERAHAAAQAYLARHPVGSHVARMQRVLAK